MQTARAQYAQLSFAIAASQAAGVRELFGTPSRCIHQGKAAMAGVLACLWAREGVENCADIIGGPHGLRVFSGIVRHEPILAGLGERFSLMQTSYKRHAASGSVHAAIDATIALRDEYRLSPANIETVEYCKRRL
jgi:2-methylcitrate dehydratase PrpD